MKRNSLILRLTIVFSLLSVLVTAQTTTKTIRDRETGLPVPYATAFNSDTSVVRSANADGMISMELMSGSLYTISQIGYKPIRITAAKHAFKENT